MYNSLFLMNLAFENRNAPLFYLLHDYISTLYTCMLTLR